MANIGTEAGNFFQTDQDIAKQKLKAEKYNYIVGDAIKLSSKGLDLIVVDDNYAYVAESGFIAKRINLKVKLMVTNKLFKDHTGPVTSLALSGDGKYLWTGSWDKTIKKWNTSTGECLLTLRGHTDFVKTILLVGRYLYSGSSDNHIFQWDISADKPSCTAVFKGHSRPVESLSLSPDGRYMFSASTDLTVKKWDLESKICVQTFVGHDTSIYCVKAGEDEIWTASADKSARRWNTETGAVDTVLEHPDRVKSLVLAGPYIVTGASDDLIRVWDVASGKLVSTIDGHFDEVSALAAVGSNIYSVSLDCSLRRWSITASALKEYNDQMLTKKKEKEKKEKESGLTEEEERELAELMSDDDDE
ncbi:WD40-repeat-containing domain protein [Phycomyces nitens]|nr:WD40-repeat-containing domain protein [Phycomyces nitens]